MLRRQLRLLDLDVDLLGLRQHRDADSYFDKPAIRPHNGGIFDVWIIDDREARAALLASDIKAAFASPASLNRTLSAVEGAEALGMDDGDVVAVIQDLTNANFDKSMTSYANATVRQDVYKPSKDGRRIYVKFTLNAQQELLLISFKGT